MTNRKLATELMKLPDLPVAFIECEGLGPFVVSGFKIEDGIIVLYTREGK